MKLTFTTLLLGIILMSCTNGKKIAHDTVIISGKIIDPNSAMVYLNRVNHFEYYKDDYLVDSTAIAKNGTFSFKINKSYSNLYTLSTSNFLPFTYQVYRKNPERYYFANCEKFFTQIPTLYIHKEDSLNIVWYNKPSIDSIVSLDNSADNQVKMRSLYLETTIDKRHTDYNNYSIDKNTQWNNLLKEQNRLLKQIDTTAIDDELSFDNYMYSEYVLGTLNAYLNWYEIAYTNKVEVLLKTENKQSLYHSIFMKYERHNWNPNSLQYYKFTERFVNYKMNLNNSSFKKYHLPSELKISVAAKVLSGKNKDLYLKLLRTQQE